MAASASSRQRFSRPLLWAGLGVCLAAVFVQTTRSGVDVLAVLVAAFVLLLLERTLGDWIADTLGSGAAALIFAGIAVAGMVYVASASGHASASRFFAAAEARGYRAAYFAVSSPARGPDLPTLRVSSPSAAPNSDGDSPVSGAVEALSSALPGRPASARPSELASAAPAPRRAATGVRITRLRLSAEVAVVGQPVELRAEATADDDGELPRIEFSIDGRVIATAPTEGGRASTTWSTKVPGQYVVRARLPGSFRGAGVSALLTVMPGRVGPEPRRRNIR